MDEVSIVDLFGWWRGCRCWGWRRKSYWLTGGNRMNDVVTIAAVSIDVIAPYYNLSLFTIRTIV
jgi:hypothetical protein